MRNLSNITSSSDGWHVASLIVLCRPEALADAAATIADLPGTSVPERDAKGKLIVLIEAANEAALMDPIRSIEHMPGVISVSLVFHQIDH